MISPVTKLFLSRLLAEERCRLQEAVFHTTPFGFVMEQLSALMLSNLEGRL
jgi:hypothetical protein